MSWRDPTQLINGFEHPKLHDSKATAAAAAKLMKRKIMALRAPLKKRDFYDPFKDAITRIHFLLKQALSFALH